MAITRQKGIAKLGILTKANDFEKALDALSEAGYEIQR